MQINKKLSLYGLVLALSIACFFSSCTNYNKKSNDCLVVAVGKLDGVFNPFTVYNHYDHQVVSLVNETVFTVDSKGVLSDNLAIYQAPEFIKDENDKITHTLYRITLKENLTFSDFHPITADDVIFSLYAFLDPNYQGFSTLSTAPILGLYEYKENNQTNYIEGITKIDETTVQIATLGYNSKLIYDIANMVVAPKHYYGDLENPLPFQKGSFQRISEKSSLPLGAGPYIFDSYKDNVVTLKANPLYLKGSPNIPKIKLQVASESSLINGVYLNEYDIASPIANPDTISLVNQYNLHYQLKDFAGYGYIGINSQRISDLNVRKGLFCLINKQVAVNTYFGDTATVIERPLSSVSWAYPSKSPPLYSFDIKQAESFFTLAGYHKKTTKDGVILLKNGKQLEVEIAIAGDGTLNHPNAPIVTRLKEELEKMGGKVIITDCDVSVLFEKLQSGAFDMYVAGRSTSIMPDLFPQFHTNGINNYAKLSDQTLDELIVEINSTVDIETKTTLFSEALDYIMNLAVEMPIYQRSDIIIINPKFVDISSFPNTLNPFNHSLDNSIFHSLKLCSP